MQRHVWKKAKAKYTLGLIVHIKIVQSGTAHAYEGLLQSIRGLVHLDRKSCTIKIHRSSPLNF